MDDERGRAWQQFSFKESLKLQTGTEDFDEIQYVMISYVRYP